MHPDSQLETAIQKGFDPKSLYSAELTNVNEPVRTILEQYSKIPAAQILQHVKDLKDRAFAVFPYACIGQASFLELSIASSPCYPEMLERVNNGEKLLDLGCAFGQELRQLIYDGAPSENLYGSDLRREFLDLGYDLFLDRSISKSHFISADVLDDNSDLVTELKDQLGIVYISLFLHVFDFDKQVTVAKRVLDLLEAKPGSLIVCRVVMCRDQETLNATSARLPYYYHDLASWERLWERVQKETSIKLNVQSWEQEDALAKKHPLPGIYVLGSSIRRE
ncbi:uncharacterized protein N7496_000061 [Penicillium cataractarum]|uniref:Methyltransferase domain-containing protein n=1 Tax=Penicillium cataractarum TaxID=2100454 RepID=A0A9W9VTE5_9EURO|nr:uncharacterized protein N7496_000061 [Penicillium cataractarum]KAJ5388993.1 hypothetical protein N7496_000061 [Penicillium cataractarum]